MDLITEIYIEGLEFIIEARDEKATWCPILEDEVQKVRAIIKIRIKKVIFC